MDDEELKDSQMVNSMIGEEKSSVSGCLSRFRQQRNVARELIS